MATKACVFVDGENFRYSLLDLFGSFRREDYLPRAADWTAFFDWIVHEVTAGQGERIRTYWYAIEKMDFFPYKYPDAVRDEDTCYRLLSKYRPFKDELDSLVAGPPRARRMDEMIEELRRRQGKLSKRFDGWTNIQEGIATQHVAVEFRRAGAIRCNLF